MKEQPIKSFITSSAYAQLIEICKEAKPIEACGIVASSLSVFAVDGVDSDVHPIIDVIIPITNTHIDPTHSFSFDPAEWTTVYYDMQKNRQKLVGLFHSHPRTEAVPSSSDVEGFLPASELSYWIVSLKNDDSPHVQPFIRSNGAFVPVELVLA